ncbi:MAG: hypothetical protein ACXVSJ_15855 [Solirubrobacteraceae bacterium]
MKELSLTLTDVSIDEMYDAMGAFSEGVGVADDDQSYRDARAAWRAGHRSIRDRPPLPVCGIAPMSAPRLTE